MTQKTLRFAAIVIFLATAGLVHAAIPPAENLLPADTFVFFTIPDCDALRAASKVSPQLMFWNDPAMQPFRDKFMGKLTQQYIAPLERNLGVKVADFVDLPQGQVTVGVTVNGSNGHDDVPPGWFCCWMQRTKVICSKKISPTSLKNGRTPDGLCARK